MPNSVDTHKTLRELLPPEVIEKLEQSDHYKKILDYSVSECGKYKDYFDDLCKILGLDVICLPGFFEDFSSPRYNSGKSIVNLLCYHYPADKYPDPPPFVSVEQYDPQMLMINQEKEVSGNASSSQEEVQPPQPVDVETAQKREIAARRIQNFIKGKHMRVLLETKTGKKNSSHSELAYRLFNQESPIRSIDLRHVEHFLSEIKNGSAEEVMDLLERDLDDAAACVLTLMERGLEGSSTALTMNQGKTLLDLIQMHRDSRFFTIRVKPVKDLDGLKLSREEKALIFEHMETLLPFERSKFTVGVFTSYYPVNLQNLVLAVRYPYLSVMPEIMLGEISPRQVMESLLVDKRPQNTAALGSKVSTRVHHGLFTGALEVSIHDTIHTKMLRTVPSEIVRAQQHLIESLLSLTDNALSKEIWYFSDMSAYYFTDLTRGQVAQLVQDSKSLTEVFCLCLVSRDDEASWLDFFYHEKAEKDGLQNLEREKSPIMWQLVLDMYFNSGDWLKNKIDPQFLVGPFKKSYDFVAEHQESIAGIEDRKEQIFILSFLEAVSLKEPEHLEQAKQLLKEQDFEKCEIQKYRDVASLAGDNSTRNRLAITLDDKTVFEVVDDFLKPSAQPVL